MDNLTFRPLPDSGERREFETGALRDIVDGKGRCDLLPLDIVGLLMKDITFTYMEKYKFTGDCDYLRFALQEVITKLDYTSYAHAFLEVSKHFESGANKYGENNWQKGIPTYSYIDSAVRHYFKYLECWDDEPHDRAVIWNLLCCIWTCENKPELNTYARFTEKEQKASDNLEREI